jgi:hypothetical protein
MRLSVHALLVLACATPSKRAQASLRDQDGPYHVEVLVDGAPAPTFFHQGETWVMGRMGDRYEIKVENRSDRRVEAVVSVDGRDVVDGKRASFGKRGYLVQAWGDVVIDGYRLSQREAAAFRFSSVPRSYAARLGDARDVGVIGVAIFPERPRPMPLPRPLLREDSRAERGPSDQAAGAPAAPSAEARGKSSAFRDEGDHLGTEFGERRDSPVYEVEFQRAGSRPAAVLGVRYDDRDGLIAAGVPVEPVYSQYDEVLRRRHARPFPAERRFAQPPPGWDP